MSLPAIAIAYGMAAVLHVPAPSKIPTVTEQYIEETARSQDYARMAPRCSATRADEQAPNEIFAQLLTFPELEIHPHNRESIVEVLQDPYLRSAVIAHLFVLQSMKQSFIGMQTVHLDTRDLLGPFDGSLITKEYLDNRQSTIQILRDILLNPKSIPFETDGYEHIAFYDRKALDENEFQLEPQVSLDEAYYGSEDASSESSRGVTPPHMLDSGVPTFEELMADFQVLRSEVN